MIFTGEKVKILNEKAEGLVKKILNKNFALVQVGDFEYEYPLSNLVKIEEKNSSPLSKKIQIEKTDPGLKEIIFKKEQDSSFPKIKLIKGKKSSVLEIDLHCHEIIEDCTGMSNSRILDYQLNYFIRELENAISRKVRTIIFIHGKGEGVLKTEIRRILSSHDNIIFYDAPLRFYGGGATQVEIH